jgi:hypothetical protein
LAVPSEIRHIVFSAAEVASAIREHRRHIERPLPAGSLRQFEMHHGKAGLLASFDIAAEILPAMSPSITAPLLIRARIYRRRFRPDAFAAMAPRNAIGATQN